MASFHCLLVFLLLNYLLPCKICFFLCAVAATVTSTSMELEPEPAKRRRRCFGYNCRPSMPCDICDHTLPQLEEPLECKFHHMFPFHQATDPRTIASWRVAQAAADVRLDRRNYFSQWLSGAGHEISSAWYSWYRAEMKHASYTRNVPWFGALDDDHPRKDCLLSSDVSDKRLRFRAVYLPYAVTIGDCLRTELALLIPVVTLLDIVHAYSV